MNTISVPVFVCHTSDLDPWVQELRRYRPRRNTQFRCEFWVDDQEITAGEVWRGRATTAIARAHGALLLVGERFMDSQPIQNEEWPLINERRRHGFPIVFVPIAGFDKEKLQALLCLQKLDDLIAVPPWDRPLPPSPHGVSVRVLDRIVVATLRAVSVKSEELYNTVKHSFSLEQRLGIGPTASTYLARDHNLNREVVIKCLTKIEKSDIFIQSAKRLGRIPAHSNIASTYAAHLNVDPYYCIQEFIQGQSLRRRLDGNPEGFPIDLTKKILASLCSAINHCHTLGERGLNIKPSNIILRNDDDVIFCPSSGDETVFMSKDGPDCLGPDMVYMPPEQRSLIRSVDKSKADQYRIGVLGYEMLLGPNKFASQQAYCACLPTSDTALGGSNTQVKWCPIETLRRDCPKFLSDVINRMVDLEPERRFDSVRHALREIERRDLMIEIARESYKRILNGGRAGQIEFLDISTVA